MTEGVLVRRVLLVGVVVSAAWVAVACGGSSAGSVASDAPESFEDLGYESPIADFLGVDTSFDFSSDDAQAEMVAEQNRVEETTAACMREQGFEYTPVDSSQFMSFGGPGEEELPYFSPEWVEKYGFGISTQMFPQSEVGPDLVGYDDSQFGDEGFEEEFQDPNSEYVESLSEAERVAYYEALHGDSPDITEGASDEEIDAFFQDWQPTGCQNEAYENSDMFGGGDVGRFYEEFGDEFEAIDERVEADQRVRDYRDEVNACLAEDGLEYTGMQDVYEQFESRLNGIGGQFYGDPFEDSGVDPDQMSDEEIDAFLSELEMGGGMLSDEDRATLAEVQADELELARAVVACGGGQLKEAFVLGEIRVEYEQEFLDTNADRLGEFEGSAQGP
ncbi:MAG: hypothetical protein GY745_00020 [Actinomycetia bacterium]|nr:hypothetical protein [Actinomycetes bacterium]